MSESGIGRVIAAFHGADFSHAALEAAAALAGSLDTELAGIFVEDTRLLRIAALPFALELGMTSALARPIESPDIERALRLQAWRTRQMLAERAGELKLHWSFQVVRGSVLAAVLGRVTNLDVVVFAEADRTAMVKGAVSARRLPFASWPARPIAVVFNDSSTAVRALSVARSIADATNADLAILIVAEAVESFETLRAKADGLLADCAHMVRHLWLKGSDSSEIAQAVSAANAAMLLWHDRHPPHNQAMLRELLRTLGCPLVLVG
jgi:hypothetical protein